MNSDSWKGKKGPIFQGKKAFFWFIEKRKIQKEGGEGEGETLLFAESVSPETRPSPAKKEKVKRGEALKFAFRGREGLYLRRRGGGRGNQRQRRGKGSLIVDGKGGSASPLAWGKMDRP